MECGIFLQRTAPHPAYSEEMPPLLRHPTKAFLMAKLLLERDEENDEMKISYRSSPLKITYKFIHYEKLVGFYLSLLFTRL